MPYDHTFTTSKTIKTKGKYTFYYNEYYNEYAIDKYGEKILNINGDYERAEEIGEKILNQL